MKEFIFKDPNNTNNVIITEHPTEDKAVAFMATYYPTFKLERKITKPTLNKCQQ